MSRGRASSTTAAAAASSSPGSAVAVAGPVVRPHPLGIVVERSSHDRGGDRCERRRRDGDGLDESAHASSITARASRRPGTEVPPSRDTGRGDRGRDRSSLRAGASGRRVFWRAADRGPKPPHRTGVTTVTIQHSPAPARSDVGHRRLRTGSSPPPPVRRARPRRSPPAPSPGRPRSSLSATTRTSTVGELAVFGVGSGLFQVGLLFLLRTLWRTQALGEGRLARGVAPPRGLRRQHGDRLDARRRRRA